MIKFKCYECSGYGCSECSGTGEVNWQTAERLIRERVIPHVNTIHETMYVMHVDEDEYTQQYLELLAILKPCPFCQSSRTDIVRDKWGFSQGVQCLDCGVNCMMIREQPGTKKAALYMVVKKWNTRLSKQTFLEDTK